MSIYSDQAAVKPKAEDVAGEFIGKERLRDLMDFLGFLQENKLTPRWASWNSWTVKCKGKNVCYIKFRDASWFVMFSAFTREKWFVGYDKYFVDDGLKDFILGCNMGNWCKDCAGHKKTVFGREIDVVCPCWAFRVENPDGAALERTKEAILATKRFINDLSK